MKKGPLRRWRERGGRRVSIVLPFDDIMEFALALLSVPPDELEELGWSFADRKRLLDHFLRSRKAAQGVACNALGQTLIALRLPGQPIYERAVPAADGRQWRHLLDEPVGQRLGQRGNGELLLVDENQTDRPEDISNAQSR